MALQYVGSTSGSNILGGTITLSLTSLSGGISSSAAANDIVIIIDSAGTNANRDMTMSTSGYTEVADLYGNNSIANDANLGVFYKVMGSTPDTSAVVGATASTDAHVAIAYVWRGVNTTTPLDVTSTTATSTTGANPDAPSITPTTSGAVVIACGGSASSSSLTTPSGMSNGASAAVAPGWYGAAAAASYAWSSGAYNPAAWTGGTPYFGSSSFSAWAAVSLALRPDNNLSISVYDSVSITESVSIERISGPSALVFDAVSISENVTFFLSTRNLSVSDSVSVSENVSAAKNLFPTFFHDTFTGSDGTLLTNHDPEIGSGWTEVITNGDDNLIIDVNTLYHGGGGNDGALATADLPTVYPSADYEVEAIDVSSSSASDEPVTIAVRVQDANNLYALAWTQSEFAIYKRLSGTWSTLSSGTVYPANGDTIKFRVDGTSLKGFINGTERVSTTDSSITAAGKAGAGIGAVRYTDDDVGGGGINELKVNIISVTASVSDSISVAEDISVAIETGSTGVTISVFDSVGLTEWVGTTGLIAQTVFDAVTLVDSPSVAVRTPIGELKDNFDDNSIDTGKWTTWTSNGSVSETGGQIQLSVTPSTSGAEADLISIQEYSLTGSSLIVNVVQCAGNGVDTAIFLQNDYGDRLAWLLNPEGNTAYAFYDIDYSWVQSQSLTLAAGTNTYVRIRESAGTVYWDYSTDGGQSWTNAMSRSVSNLAFDVDSLTAYINTYEYSSSGAGVEDTSIIDNFNIVLTTRSVSVSDQITISENVQTAGVLSQSVFDQVAVTENIQTAGQVAISVFDQVTISESIQTAGQLARSVSDQVTIAEYVQTAGQLARSISDQVVVAETVYAVEEVSVLVFDAVGITEAAQTTGTLFASVLDQVSIEELSQAAIGTDLAFSIYENISITEDLTFFVTVRYIGIFDGVSISDTAVAVLNSNINVFDGVTVTDVAQTGNTFPLTIFDQVVLVEGVQTAGTLSQSVHDQVAIVDAAGASAVVFVSVFDQLSITDTIQTSGSTSTAVFDSVGITDVVAIGGTLAVSIFDQLAIVEDSRITTILFISVSDAISASETIQTAGDLSATVVDLVFLSEGVSIVSVLSVGVVDSVSVSEEVALGILSFVSVFDSILVSDQVITGGSISLLVSDVITVEDSPTVAAEGNAVNTVDALTVQEFVQVGPIQVNIFVTDDILIEAVSGVAQVHTIEVYDQVTIVPILAAFPDTVHISEFVEVFVETAGASIAASVVDSVGIEDQIEIFSVFPIEVWDAITIYPILAAYPDTVHISELVEIFVEDSGVSLLGYGVDDITILDQIVDILTVIDSEFYDDILIEDVAEVVIENLVIEVTEDINYYDIVSLSGVTWLADVWDDVLIEDSVEPLIPFVLIDVGDDVVLIDPAGAKSALTINGIDQITISDVPGVTKIYDIFVTDAVAIEGVYPDINFNLITYFVYDEISVNERPVVYTRDPMYENVTPPKYRGRGTHGEGQGKRFSGYMEKFTAGSSTNNEVARLGYPGAGTRDRYSGTAISS